jgi:hypothetical protein
VFQAKVLKGIHQQMHLGHLEQVAVKELFDQFIKIEVQIIHVKIVMEGIQIMKLLLVVSKFIKYNLSTLRWLQEVQELLVKRNHLQSVLALEFIGNQLENLHLYKPIFHKLVISTAK